MISAELRSIRGLCAAVEQWHGALRNSAPTLTARAHVLDDIRAHMERMQLPHGHLENDVLEEAVDDLHSLVLDAPRISWRKFTHRLCSALYVGPDAIGRVTNEA